MVEICGNLSLAKERVVAPEELWFPLDREVHNAERDRRVRHLGDFRPHP